MKNFVQPGEVIHIDVAPYARLSGQGCLVGSLFGIAAADADSAGNIELACAGVFDIEKVSALAWTQGALIYWDNAAKNCTTTSAGNKLIGVATEAAANPSATGRVRLNGAFTT
jgi:predicted RecA/RadA family phage recombinase